MWCGSAWSWGKRKHSHHSGSGFSSVKWKQFKEAPSVRSSIVWRGVEPRAALLFPLLHWTRPAVTESPGHAHRHQVGPPHDPDPTPPTTSSFRYDISQPCCVTMETTCCEAGRGLGWNLGLLFFFLTLHRAPVEGVKSSLSSTTQWTDVRFTAGPLIHRSTPS